MFLQFLVKIRQLPQEITTVVWSVFFPSPRLFCWPWTCWTTTVQGKLRYLAVYYNRCV